MGRLIVEVVFEEPTWKETWEPMMRADFKLFDEPLGQTTPCHGAKRGEVTL